MGQEPTEHHQSSMNDIADLAEVGACALYRILHVTAKPQVAYVAVYMDWKLQNKCEKRSLS